MGRAVVAAAVTCIATVSIPTLAADPATTKDGAKAADRNATAPGPLHDELVAPLLESPAPVLSMPEDARLAGERLRAALALGDTDVRESERHLSDLESEFPILADVIALAAASRWLQRDDTVRAENAAGKGLQAGPSPGLIAPLESVRAQAAVAVGAEALARAAYDKAADAAKGRNERSRYRLAVAESHERSGDLASAGAGYHELWLRSPTTPSARRAGERLDALAGQPGIPARTATEWMRRADALYEARRSALALEAYEAASAGPLGARNTRHVAMRRAMSLFRTRRYPDAVKAFSDISGAEARFWRARALARAGQVEESIDIFEAIANTKGARRAVWSRYLAAILHAGRGRHEAARAHYERVLAGGGDLGRNARWRLAWQAYLEGRFPDARSHLTRLTKQRADPIDRLRPRYWAARALETTDPARAAEELRGIAREYPLTYYGLQARSVLGEGGVSALPNKIQADPATIREVDLFRARVAVAAGEQDIAQRLLRELRPRAKRIRDRLALAELYHAAGDSYPALQLIVVPYSGMLARGIDPAIPELWRAAWPRPFPELVRTWSPEGLETSVVWSVMREESGFRVAVESITGALGLLQIQPTTGERLAQEVGLEGFESERLTDPEVNVRLGAFYLHSLTDEFGVLPPAIASYNAGEHRVRDWVAEGPDPESDVWIESIPFTQTRNYVKRVMRNLTYYRALELADAAAVPPPVSAPEMPHKAATRSADTAEDEATHR